MKNKKSFLPFCFIAAMALASCSGTTSGSETSSSEGSSSDTSSTSEQGEIQLKFWHGFTGQDGDGMAEIVKDFNTEYTGKIKVSVEKLSWDTLFLKLVQNKNNPKYSPNIVAVDSSRLEFCVSRDFFMDISDIATALNVSESDFLTTAWNVGTLGGTTRYSFPLDIHPISMFYNKDIVGSDALPTTWDEFLTSCKKYTSEDSGVYGYAMPNMYSTTKDIFYSMLLQQGTDILDSDNKPIFNSDTGVADLTKMYNWKYSDVISPSSVGAGGDLTLFEQGRSAFYFDGPWMINSVDSAVNFDMGVAPMPGSTGTGGTSFSGSHQLGLMKSTVTDDATKQACYTFINYVSSNAMAWAKAGQVPARKAVLDTDEYKALPYHAAFTEQAECTSTGHTNYKYFYECYNYMGSAVANAINKTKEPKASLDEKTEAFNKYVIEEEE